MDQVNHSGRRQFLQLAAFSGAMLLSGCKDKSQSQAAPQAEEQKPEEDISPVEDLMREHGVLKRVLLIYGELIARIDAHNEIPRDAARDSATIIRNFIEAYHEKLEEEHLFPRFRKARQLAELVDVLEAQHKAGRALTDTVLQLTETDLKHPADQRTLRQALSEFIRMYSPHEAREDTVLFPAFHTIVPPKEYDTLGDEFEKKEHELFGENGFEGMVDRVAKIERALGLYDLAQFTPKR